MLHLLRSSLRSAAAAAALLAFPLHAAAQAAEDPAQEHVLVDEVSERALERTERTLDTTEALVERAFKQEILGDSRATAQPFPTAAPSPVAAFTPESLKDLEAEVDDLERSIPAPGNDGCGEDC